MHRIALVHPDPGYPFERLHERGNLHELDAGAYSAETRDTPRRLLKTPGGVF